MHIHMYVLPVFSEFCQNPDLINSFISFISTFIRASCKAGFTPEPKVQTDLFIALTWFKRCRKESSSCLLDCWSAQPIYLFPDALSKCLRVRTVRLLGCWGFTERRLGSSSSFMFLYVQVQTQRDGQNATFLASNHLRPFRFTGYQLSGCSTQHSPVAGQ